MKPTPFTCKHFAFFLATFFLMAFCFPGKASGTEWVSLGKTRLGTFYFDRQSIKNVSNDIRSVDTKIVFSTEGRKQEREWKKKQKESPRKINQLKSLSHRIESHEFDCRKKQHRFVMSAEYTLKGALLEKIHFKESTFFPVTPCSMEEDMWNIVCEKGQCGKEGKSCP